MTTLIPRDPYSKDELGLLYPKGLKLQLVQVVSFEKLRSISLIEGGKAMLTFGLLKYPSFYDMVIAHMDWDYPCWWMSRLMVNRGTISCVWAVSECMSLLPFLSPMNAN